MDRNNIKKKGFTLVELLVVTGIIVILSGLSLAWYGNFSEDKNLDRQVQDFIQTLEMAKNKAFAGDSSVCGDVGGITPYLSQYNVVVNSSKILANPICTGSPTGYEYSIGEHMVFLTPTMEVSFGLFGKINSDKSLCIPIRNTTSNKCKYVNINETGLITSGVCTSCSPITCPCL